MYPFLPSLIFWTHQRFALCLEIIVTYEGNRRKFYSPPVCSILWNLSCHFFEAACVRNFKYKLLGNVGLDKLVGCFLGVISFGPGQQVLPHCPIGNGYECIRIRLVFLQLEPLIYRLLSGCKVSAIVHGRIVPKGRGGVTRSFYE
jgi:hypothetical protein